MGLMGPISGKGEAPPWALAPKGGLPPPLAGAPSSLVGLVPHGKGRRGCTSPWPIKGGEGCTFSTHNLIDLFLSKIFLSPLLLSSRVPLVRNLY